MYLNYFVQPRAKQYYQKKYVIISLFKLQSHDTPHKIKKIRIEPRKIAGVKILIYD